MASPSQTRPKPNQSPLKVVATSLPHVFGEAVDFSILEAAHPLISEYLFNTSTSEAAAPLLKEIAWIIKGLKQMDSEQIEDFLITLQGLKVTTTQYDITTWIEAQLILDAEKKAFFQLLPRSS